VPRGSIGVLDRARLAAFDLAAIPTTGAMAVVARRSDPSRWVRAPGALLLGLAAQPPVCYHKSVTGRYRKNPAARAPGWGWP
jgi:hypothetical protein